MSYANMKGAEDLREWTFPEEDRRLYTTTPWDGHTFRWFRSPNIICLEKYRGRQPQQTQDTGTV